ncbi:HAD family phosphatase [Nesterenkonia sp.]|uniref:HAD family hydrolase n=1 Tax=Nesterenkonia sp. TaxID=704201 RepID=UPI002631F6C2|nr:HAD family hydrolase [Nesterenkonia sp.]
MSDLQAVFWDMDGTLVDTEPYWIASEHDLVAAHGGTWSDEQAHLLVGQALEYSAAVLQRAGVTMGTTEIIDHLTADVAARCAEQIPWRPGARQLLEDLHQADVRCALVTMSYKPLAEAIVAALPEGRLEFIVSGDMVTAGKPDPEAYHLAFDTMASDHQQRTGEPLRRAQCIAIEDSVPGTAAAAASGMVTLAVPHYSQLPETGKWHLLETLEGVTSEDLAELLHRPVPAADTAAVGA